jgi:V/A-type H+/Na+-transporting ATPase subunit D
VERLLVSVNKSNLLRLEEELTFASDGRDLLDEKKEALMAHISSLSTKAERVRARLNEVLKETYRLLREALLMHGRLACERASLAVRAGEEVEVKERSFMGVVLPVVRISLPRFLPSYGFLETGFSMDAVADSIHRGLEVIAELAEIEVGLFRLMTEIKKTIKRINALENIYIPLYQATIKHIEESLEEKEREFLFQLKRQKRRREQAEHGVS